MRLLFLISVASFCSFVYSAPLNIRVAREPSIRLYKRQVVAQGYPGYITSTAQHLSSQNAAPETGSIPSKISNVAGWDRRSGTLSTAPGGQQQPATYVSAQVVPAHASSSSTEALLSPVEKTYSKSSSLASAPDYTNGNSPLSGSSAVHSQSNSNSLVAAAQSDPSIDDSYPVYYVSTPEDTNTQQQTLKNISKSKTNQSALHWQSNSNSLVGTAQSDPSRDDRYPVYYVSSPEEPNTQQQFSQGISNSRSNKSFPSPSPISTVSQSDKEDGYPVYYVSGYEEKKQQTSEDNSITKTSSLPANSTNNTSTGSHGNNYPVYYVTTYNKEVQAPKASKATGSNNSFTPGSSSLSEQGDKVPLYLVGGPYAGTNNAVQESKTKPVADSPVTYKVINSSSISQDTTKSKNGSTQSPSESAASVTPSSAFQPPSRPVVALNSRPSNLSSPSSYQMSSAASLPSSSQNQGYGSYGSSVSPASQPAYQTYSASSPAANWATSQPASSYNGYPANRAPAALSTAQSAPVNPYYAAAAAPSSASPPSSYGVSSLASSSLPQSSATQPGYGPNPPKSAPVPSPAPAPSSSSHSISGVPSSPPFPPGFQSPSTNKNQQTTSVQVSNTSYDQTSPSANVNLHPTDADIVSSSLPILQAEYENSSYIIATPPDKDTVLFLPSSSIPSSPDTDQDETSSSVSLSTNSSTMKSSRQSALVTNNSTNKAFQPQNITMITNQAVGNSNSVALPSTENATAMEEAVNFPIIRIPENATMPGWKLEDITITNATFLSNSSLEPPPTTKAENPVSSTTPTAPPSSSTTLPIVTLPSAAPASSSKTVPSDTFNIPLGPLLDSLAATTQPRMMKPPPSQFSTTPPPKRVPYPATTKPQVAFHPTTKPTEKNKEWGFGDKYLASQNQRARHRNVIFDGIAGDSQSFSNYQVLSQQEVFFPINGRRKRSIT